MDRVTVFRSFIAKSPQDPFPRYGLAMELKGRGDHDAAWTEFATLLESFPDYVPTYLMAAGFLVDLGKNTEAKELFRTGIDAAGRKGDLHAKRELEAALAQLE
jgi:Tfp pilus assembly protein PilF